MREILFRGNKKGEWFEGGFMLDDNNKPLIISDGIAGKLFIEVIPETVGQFTGLIDKNGRKIFEGDVIEVMGRGHLIEFKICSNTHYGHGDCSSTTYAGYSLGFYGKSDNMFANFEVIGNIHDNPELLTQTESKNI